jgi:hypothetical protein
MINRKDFIRKIDAIYPCSGGYRYVVERLLDDRWTVERLIRHCRSGNKVEREYFLWLAYCLYELNHCAFSGDEYFRLRLNSGFAVKLTIKSLRKAGAKKFISYVERILMNAEIVP